MTANPNLDEMRRDAMPASEQSQAEIFMSRLGGNSHDILKRLMFQICAGAAIMSALGLWFWPGATWGADVAVMKGAITVFLACVAGFLLSWRPHAADLIHVDQARREVRFLRKKGDGLRTVRRISFDNLTALYVEDDALHLVGRGVYVHETIELEPKFDKSLLRRLA